MDRSNVQFSLNNASKKLQKTPFGNDATRETHFLQQPQMDKLKFWTAQHTQTTFCNKQKCNKLTFLKRRITGKLCFATTQSGQTRFRNDATRNNMFLQHTQMHKHTSCKRHNTQKTCFATPQKWRNALLETTRNAKTTFRNKQKCNKPACLHCFATIQNGQTRFLETTQDAITFLCNTRKCTNSHGAKGTTRQKHVLQHPKWTNSLFETTQKRQNHFSQRTEKNSLFENDAKPKHICLRQAHIDKKRNTRKPLLAINIWTELVSRTTQHANIFLQQLEQLEIQKRTTRQTKNSSFGTTQCAQRQTPNKQGGRTANMRIGSCGSIRNAKRCFARPRHNTNMQSTPFAPKQKRLFRKSTAAMCDLCYSRNTRCNSERLFKRSQHPTKKTKTHLSKHAKRQSAVCAVAWTRV